MLDHLAAQARKVMTNYDNDGLFHDNLAYRSTTGCACVCWMFNRERLGLDSSKGPIRIIDCGV